MNNTKLIMLCGVPGSGKSTYGMRYMTKHHNYIMFSSDNIREELFDDVNNQSNNNLVFSTLHKRVLDSLQNNINVIYDATNMTRKNRRSLLSQLPATVTKECHIIWAPIEECVKRDERRERTVGPAVIERMLKRFQMPHYDEGFDVIKIITPPKSEFSDFDYEYKVCNDMKIPHDNHHHTYNVYTHSQKALHEAIKNNYSKEVIIAALYHDCGKPYCKTYYNAKGEATEEAHYYGHPGVSCWVAMGITTNILTLWLISNHMAPFGNEKYYALLPPHLKTELDKLHNCDLNAH